MAFTLLSPAPNAVPLAYLGQGFNIEFTCGVAVTVGDILLAELTAVAPAVGKVCAGSTFAPSASAVQQVQFGVEVIFSRYIGNAQGITLSLLLQHYTAGFALLETQTFASSYLLDGINGISLLPSPDSTLLNLIYAAVHKVF